MPKVSVVIPFYNRCAWTVEAVKSVLDQTFSDFEIILVDDGSTEAVGFPDWIINDKRVVLVRKKHEGVSAARNFGMSLSKGQYIAFLDSDDLFLPDKLMTQVGHMANHPDIYLSHTSYIQIDENGQNIQVVNAGRFGGSVYPNIINNCPIATPTVMVRKNKVSNLKFEESIHFGEDTILWIRISRTSDIYGIDNPLVKVRLHGNNTAHDPQKVLIGIKNILSYFREYDKSINLSFWMKSLSLMYEHVGKMYKAQNINSKAVKYNFLFYALWPPNIGNALSCFFTSLYSDFGFKFKKKNK